MLEKHTRPKRLTWCRLHRRVHHPAVVWATPHSTCDRTGLRKAWRVAFATGPQHAACYHPCLAHRPTPTIPTTPTCLAHRPPASRPSAAARAAPSAPFFAPSPLAGRPQPSVAPACCAPPANTRRPPLHPLPVSAHGPPPAAHAAAARLSSAKPCR